MNLEARRDHSCDGIYNITPKNLQNKEIKELFTILTIFITRQIIFQHVCVKAYSNSLAKIGGHVT
jgi:hypothetical protein